MSMLRALYLLKSFMCRSRSGTVTMGPFVSTARLRLMPDFIHQRHKPPTPLETPRELIVACAPMRININLSHIVRMAGCCGVQKVICCGNAKVIVKIARDGADSLAIDVHRTLPPVLKELKESGLPTGWAGTDHKFAEPARIPLRPPHRAGDRQRTTGPDRRPARTVGPRRGNPRLRAPLQLQRRHGNVHGPVRVLPAVSAGVAAPRFQFARSPRRRS